MKSKELSPRVISAFKKAYTVHHGHVSVAERRKLAQKLHLSLNKVNIWMRVLRCHDCFEDCSADYPFMLRKSVWDETKGGRMVLCVPCVEKRLKRELTPTDFDWRRIADPSTWVLYNGKNRKELCTDILISRMGGIDIPYLKSQYEKAMADENYEGAWAYDNE